MSKMTAEERKSNVKSTSAEQLSNDRRSLMPLLFRIRDVLLQEMRMDVQHMFRETPSSLEYVTAHFAAHSNVFLDIRCLKEQVHSFSSNILAVRTGEGPSDLLTIGDERCITVSESTSSGFRVKFSMSSRNGTADGSVSNVCTYSIEPLDT